MNDLLLRRQMMMGDEASDLPTFAGLMIAPGDVYRATSSGPLEIYNSHTSPNPTTSNRGLFSISTIGTQFDSNGASFDPSTMSIDNNGTLLSYDGYDDWRIPTRTEWGKILTTSKNTRAGSTVNGSANKHYACVYYSSTRRYYLIIFPDNRVINGTALSGMDSTTTTNVSNLNILSEYMSYGCAVLAGYGYVYNKSSQSSTYGYFGSATRYSSGYYYGTRFGYNTINTSDTSNFSRATDYYFAWRCVRDV